MGIKDLATPGTMTIEDVLEGLSPELHTALVDGMKDMGKSVFEIAAACRDDGFLITPREVQRWRVEHITEIA